MVGVGRLAGALLLLGAVAPAVALAQNASRGIPYAGRLELNGEAVDGTADLTFNLYDAYEGGAVVFTETLQDVPVSDGRFQVMLGLTAALSPQLAPYGDLFVEVAVNGRRLAGRQPLGAVPYAYRGAPTSDFVVDGDLRFGRGCAGGDPAACQPKRCIGSSTVTWNSSQPGSVVGYNTVSVRYNRQFGGTPSVVLIPACTSGTCSNFRGYTPFITSISATGFEVAWNDDGNENNLRRFHWLAVGPCP